jgi:two-component system alkaline phosphatase synthesis response regulator PhoP
MSARILVVEDEIAIALGLRNDLTLEGYTVDVVGDGEAAIDRVSDLRPDLILLDIMLPKKDGLSVCRELRRSGVTTPIIMLTARAQDTDKVMGLELGADDYVTKPFSPMELRARVKAALRRGSGAGASSRVRFGDVEVDFDRCVTTRGGTVVDLTPLELKVLQALVEARGRLLTRDQIIDRVWGAGVSISDRVVDNHMMNLRRKLEADPAEPLFLVSVRGLGYRFEGTNQTDS